jgi:uncharacterized protein YcbX
MAQNIKITGLTIYPVKSLAGISLQSSELDGMGLKFDRRWMVVAPDGLFLTQRRYPQMALVSTSLKNGQLILSKDGKDDYQVPTISADAETMQVRIWKDTVTAQRVGSESDVWLSDALGFDCHFVYIADNEVRQCSLDYADEGDRTGFADAYPMLVISEESLEDLNAKLEKKGKELVTMRRFRPNIIVAGCDAFAEDNWKSLSIAGIAMRGVKLCDRCILTTVDPLTGERTGKEPLETLGEYRKWDNNVYFGMNIVHDQLGSLKLGDDVTVL